MKRNTAKCRRGRKITNPLHAIVALCAAIATQPSLVPLPNVFVNHKEKIVLGTKEEDLAILEYDISYDL